MLQLNNTTRGWHGSVIGERVGVRVPLFKGAAADLSNSSPRPVGQVFLA